MTVFSKGGKKEIKAAVQTSERKPFKKSKKTERYFGVYDGGGK